MSMLDTQEVLMPHRVWGDDTIYMCTVHKKCTLKVEEVTHMHTTQQVATHFSGKRLARSRVNQPYSSEHNFCQTPNTQRRGKTKKVCIIFTSCDVQVCTVFRWSLVLWCKKHWEVIPFLFLDFLLCFALFPKYKYKQPSGLQHLTSNYLYFKMM